MTHMWRRGLGKNADILFTVPTGVPFWGGPQFEPLIVAIVFPLAHVSHHTGPWTVKGTDMGEYYEHALKEGFKRPPNGPGTGRPLTVGHGAWDSSGASCPFSPGGGDSGQLHVLDRPLPGVFEDPEAGSWTLLWELLATAGKLPPVQKCLVRQVLQGVPKQQLLQNGPPPKRLRPGS